MDYGENQRMSGFTVLELLVVVGLIGITAAIVTLAVTSAREKARLASDIAFAHNLEIAQAGYTNGSISASWDFNGNAKDSSGNGNNASGIAAYVSDSPIQGTKAARMSDGVTTSVPGKNLPTGSLCFSTFRKYEGEAAGHALYLYPFGSPRFIFAFYGPSSGNAVEFRTGSASFSVPAKTMSVVGTNRWYHITVSYDATTGTGKIWVDGKKIYERTQANMVTATPYAATNLSLKPYPWNTQTTYIGPTKLWPFPCKIS